MHGAPTHLHLLQLGLGCLGALAVLVGTQHLHQYNKQGWTKMWRQTALSEAAKRAEGRAGDAGRQHSQTCKSGR